MNIRNVCLSAVLVCLIGLTAISSPVKKSTDTSAIYNLLINNQFQKADAKIETVLEKNSSNIQYQILSAVSLAMQNKLDSAQDILDVIKPNARSYADYYYAQGIVYLHRIDTSDLRYRNKSEELVNLAIKQFDYSLKITPDNSLVYNALGVAELKKDNLFKAQKYFEKAISLNPKYAVAIDNLGSIYYITNELDIAEKYFKKAVDINPTATGYYHLAQIAMKKGDTQKALYYSNKTLLWKTRSTYAYNLMGEIYRKQGNEAAAIVAFKKSIFLMPENVAPYINLASIYETRGDSYSAIKELRTAYSICPNDDLLKLNIADLLLTNEKYEDAIKYYTQVSDKYRANTIEGLVSAYYALSVESAVKAGVRSNSRLKDAMVYIDKAIKENPDDLELYIIKSKIDKLLNNKVASKDTLLKIISAPSSDVSDSIAKCEAYIALNNYRDAYNLYKQIIISPKNTKYNLYLAEYFIYNKQYSLANETLDIILKKEPNNEDALRNSEFIKQSLELSAENYNNSLHFKKHHDKFFQKLYLKKSLKYNPYNVDANILYAELLKAENDYITANKCYKRALCDTNDEKLIKSVSAESRKLDKKIIQLEKKYERENAVKNSNEKSVDAKNEFDVIPVKNLCRE